MKFYKFWFPVILYSGIIFYISSLPNLKSPSIGIPLDKPIHGTEYMVLGFLFVRALNGAKEDIKVKLAFAAAFLFCICFGISDEFHQSFVPGRDSSVFDLLADSVGAFCGVFLYLFMKTRHPKKIIQKQEGKTS